MKRDAQAVAPCAEAIAFFDQLAAERGQRTPGRIDAVTAQLRDQGVYEMSTDELTFAAELAWRNSPRCIGRRFWRGVVVRDMRHLRRAADIAEACFDHLRESYNGGRLRPTLTVFAARRPPDPGIRIWNSQLIRYAGYRQEDGRWIGDPANAALTERARALGWRGEGGPFDVLPLLVQLPGEAPERFEIPRDAVEEVPIRHPTLPWFEALKLRWHAVPAISDMLFDAGGLEYTAAPFSGWYMNTEIASRNFADTHRYDLLPTIAERLGLDRQTEPLWRDRALLELNAAVLYSFSASGVTMVDHHTASQDFMRFVEAERAAGREALAEWSWIVPPMSSAACPVFHADFRLEVRKPNFFYQD